MSTKTLPLNSQLHEYLLAHSVHESKVQLSLRKETAALSSAAMQISPEQGQFMALLLQLMQAKRVLEVGCFTGYSALCMALALPTDGQLITCDHDQRWLEMATRHWEQAGVAHKIQFKLGRALNSLDQLIAEGQQASFDFAFIDADKAQYDNYYERCLVLVRPGGLIAIDNVLWEGSVADTSDQEHTTIAIRALNQKLYNDARIKLSMVPIGDGLSLALKL
ncbi:MAG TPA: class I SAM-dependent methyltransferase [Coxiellaceae bacterium]|nr:class I SAM-dependent methyltransferase [Coxiellaceae bacterium]